MSSFANCRGGDLVFGIKEESGLPVSLSGVQVPDVDVEVNRLESIISQGIEPRVSQRIKFVPLAGGGHVVVIRIDQSWNGPHRVTFKGWDKFYSRNSAGKYPLDVGELRTAFTAGVALADKLRAFRMDRITRIINSDFPLPFIQGSLAVLHYLPYRTFLNSQPAFSLRDIHPFTVPLLSADQQGSRVNLEGILTYAGSTQSHAYTQVFRNGVVESVSGTVLRTTKENVKYIPYIALEQRVLQHVHSTLHFLGQQGVELPIAIALTLTNTEGYEMAKAWNDFDVGSTIREKNLVLPEVLAEDSGTPVTKLMKPIFDLIWNACGYIASRDFDEDGNWNNPSYPLTLK